MDVVANQLFWDVWKSVNVSKTEKMSYEDRERCVKGVDLCSPPSSYSKMEWTFKGSMENTSTVAEFQLFSLCGDFTDPEPKSPPVGLIFACRIMGVEMMCLVESTTRIKCNVLSNSIPDITAGKRVGITLCEGLFIREKTNLFSRYPGTFLAVDKYVAELLFQRYPADEVITLV